MKVINCPSCIRLFLVGRYTLFLLSWLNLLSRSQFTHIEFSARIDSTLIGSPRGSNRKIESYRPRESEKGIDGGISHSEIMFGSYEFSNKNYKCEIAYITSSVIYPIYLIAFYKWWPELLNYYYSKSTTSTKINNCFSFK